MTFKGESLYFIYRLAMVLTGPEPAAATAPGKLRRVKNEINHAAEKHFDIEEITDVDSTVNREVYTIWVYEKAKIASRY